MSSFKDYYKILGLGSDAAEKDIKDAYKKLAKKYHPDAQYGSEERFKELSEAYDTLKDKKKKSKYDLGYRSQRQSGTSQNYKQSKMYSDFKSYADMHQRQYFKEKFQEKNARNRDERDKQPNGERASEGFSKPSEKKDEGFGDFFETFFGKYKEQAEGKDAAANPTGEQTKTSTEASKGDDYEMEVELAFEDAHQGTIRKIEITGANQTTRRLEVSIPAGVREGTKVKVANEGKPGANGGENGDLYLKVKLQEHPSYWLEGDDVHSELSLLPHEAVLGVEKNISTLNDSVDLVIPPMSKNGKVLRLKSQGMFKAKEKENGDHYVHIAIDIPDEINTEEMHTYKYLRELNDRK